MEKLAKGAEKLGIYLDPPQLQQFETYYHEIISGNTRVNLTSITDYEETQVKHFLDSLTVTLAMPPLSKKQSFNIIDVGAGAGLPGIPLKIVFPGIGLTLLEATAKKVRFLENLVTKLGLSDIRITAGRAETIARDTVFREQFDIALARALAPLPVLVELTLPFCKVGGSCIAPKKGNIQREVEQSTRAIEVMGGRLREIKSIPLEEFNDRRCLVVIDKIKTTPPQYPRRPGMPTKRPILS